MGCDRLRLRGSLLPPNSYWSEDRSVGRPILRRDVTGIGMRRPLRPDARLTPCGFAAKRSGVLPSLSVGSPPPSESVANCQIR